MTSALRRIRSHASWLLFAAVIALCAGGCFNPFSPLVATTRGVSSSPPVPNSAQNVLRLFEWCWNNRAIAEYREIFTDDYRFAFAVTDSAGNAFRDRELNREDELTTANNLFVEGSANAPPANSISLSFDRNLLALPDSRPGKNGRWHKEIRTQVTLNIRAGDVAYDVTGALRFFVTRGDSALIPKELKDRGFGRDSTRWYIERLEDETAQSSTVVYGPPPEATTAGLAREQSAGPLRAALLSEFVSLGYIKALYAPPPR